MTANNHAIKEYQRVYVWELPVGFFHWINAVCIFSLAVTGYLIGDPVAIASNKEAYQQYWFGTIRFIHFTTAYIFLINFLFRIYWGIVGNIYVKWKTLIPHKKWQFKEMVDVLKIDILQTEVTEKIFMGHNSLAAITYLIIFLLTIFQIVIGFAIYSPMSESWFPQLFTWVVTLFGGDHLVRQLHHITMWVFIVFTIIHVYLTFYHDYVEGRGTVSSMVGGWKFKKK